MKMSPNTAATIVEEKPMELVQEKPANEEYRRADQPLNYVNIFFIGLAHLACVYFLLTFQWITKFYIVLYTAVNMHLSGLGVTAGAHRYFTHRSYKINTPLKILLLILYASCGHNKLFDWVRDHRTHHKFVETDADPHNSNRGFFFSHVGWLLMKKHPEVLAKGSTIDMSDISGDKLLVWYDRHYILMKTIFCFIVPTITLHYVFDEDWYTCITTQCIVRYILLLNITWSVNSLAHLYGNKPYDIHGNSKDNLSVAILTVGEGWHNYHHAFPWDYRASEFGKINFTTKCLNFFGKIGWAYDFKIAPDDLIRRVAEKCGDGTHEVYGHLNREDKSK